MRFIKVFMMGFLVCVGMPALAAFSCNITTASVGVLYTAANVDTNGSVTITCTRNPATDPATLTYRIKANDGTNPRAAAPFRRVERGTTGNFLNYILRRGTVGGAATCTNATNWRAPATGVTNVGQGTLAFTAGASSASAIWGYCIRLRGTAGGNPAAPTAGIYEDSFLVTAQYPNNNAGVLSPSVPVTYTVGVTNQCVFNTFPTGMNFNYTAFSPTPQVQTRNFDLRCSNGLTWTLAVAPASGVLLGLRYNIAASPAASTGTGNDQVITLTGTIPANQAGTCATGSCTASQVHVVTITY